MSPSFPLIHESINYTNDNFYSMAEAFPHKPVAITETGWATISNGHCIDPHNVNEELQKVYYNDLMEWTDGEQILTFVFEAFGFENGLGPEFNTSVPIPDSYRESFRMTTNPLI